MKELRVFVNFDQNDLYVIKLSYCYLDQIKEKILGLPAAVKNMTDITSLLTEPFDILDYVEMLRTSNFVEVFDGKLGIRDNEFDFETQVRLEMEKEMLNAN